MPFLPNQIEPHRLGLEQAGHIVDVVVVGAVETLGALEPGWRCVAPGDEGLAASAVAGLRGAKGDLLLLLDPTMGYAPADVCAVAEALERGDAELVIASRFTARRSAKPAAVQGWLRAVAGSLIRPMAGTTDPLSGLVGMTRDHADHLVTILQPLGTKIAIELVTRTDDGWVEVPAAARWPSQRSGLKYDDLRQLKRLADHRFGNFSRLIQFCVVGASGMVVDLSCYALFQWLFRGTWMAGKTAPLVGSSLDLAAARALAILIALTWNFSLNRRLTFSYARQGSIVRQFVTYALSNFLGIALNFTLGLTLPLYSGFFNEHKLAAAVVGIVAATGISFSMSRWVVFSHRSHPLPPSQGLDAVAAVPLGEE
jgi:dolichol-phosphate mannosyltransferase